MEEHVGLWWHRWITRWADDRHAHASVSLQSMEKRIGVLYRAAGGDVAARVASASAATHAGPRAWLQRMAGSGQRAALPRLDPDVLALPPEVAVFPNRELNQDLYLWLAAMAAVFESTGDWLADNRAATARTLQRFAGLRVRHQRLVQAHLSQRPAIAQMRASAAVAEMAVQAVLRGDDHVDASVQSTDVAPVWLWFTVAPNGEGADVPRTAARASSQTSDNAPAAQSRTRRRAKAATPPDPRRALLLPSRVESIMTWSEHVKLDRATDDDEAPNALAAADDMDTLTVTPDRETLASRVRFDLDLPSAAQDDQPLGEGVWMPEWDWRHQRLQADHCCLQYLTARDASAFVPPAALRGTARQLRRRLEVLRAAPRWLHRCEQGDALDMDAWVRYQTEQRRDAPRQESAPIFMQSVRAQRSLATLLLADLSLSTDAYASSQARVIDVIRDALYVFGEALAGTGDAFEMTGFSSIRRHQVRMHRLKSFDDRWGDAARARIGAIRPGYYTRLGAAVRGATQRLLQRPERQRLLIVLTDGKPNDLDVYEGRYGLEDTRHAVQEARQQGLLPFCITIDEKAHDYMPMLFGQQGYALVHRPQELVQRLTQIWLRLGH